MQATLGNPDFGSCFLSLANSTVHTVTLLIPQKGVKEKRAKVSFFLLEIFTTTPRENVNQDS